MLRRKSGGTRCRGWVTIYHAMAEDELKHAAWLHEMTAGEITELDKVFRPTEEMQRSWDDSHARYVERAAWVRRMLEM